MARASNMKRSVETSTTGNFTAEEIREFLSEVPDAAEIEINVHRGDPRDPREAGHRETEIKATWDQTTQGLQRSRHPQSVAFVSGRDVILCGPLGTPPNPEPSTAKIWERNGRLFMQTTEEDGTTRKWVSAGRAKAWTELEDWPDPQKTDREA